MRNLLSITLLLGLLSPGCVGSLQGDLEPDDDATDDDDNDAADDDAADDDDVTDDDDATDDDDDTDADGDGYDSTEDCDDGDPDIHPGAAEQCDGVDNDCDGAVDPGQACSGCFQATHSGHTYQFCDTPIRPWGDAVDWCEDHGYYLVTVNDGAEDAFLAGQFGNSGTWWIGYNDIGNEGNFSWVAGNGSGYENWANGEPSNYLGNENCTEYGYIHWQWNDNNCNTAFGFVCETE